MTEIQHTPGRFVWHELFTPDVNRSTQFYTSLFNWTVKTIDMGTLEYPMIHAGETPIGGIMAISALGTEEDLPRHWLGYVSIPDVDEAAVGAKSGGGTVLMEPRALPKVGKFTVLMDPQQGIVAAFKAEQGDPPEVERPGLGSFCWDQLNTTDAKGAMHFYRKVFGWENVPFEGVNDLWVLKRGKRQAASLMQAPTGMPTHWLTYVVVESLADARSKVAELGGKVLVKEQRVPRIGRFCVINDDVGATIALFEGAGD